MPNGSSWLLFGAMLGLAVASCQSTSPKSGGGSGSGGQRASGGVPSSGGTIASGGTTGNGGSPGSGGAGSGGSTTTGGSGTGGAIAAGGTTGSGGSQGSGGTIASGGTTSSGGTSSAGGTTTTGGVAGGGGASAGGGTSQTSSGTSAGGASASGGAAGAVSLGGRTGAGGGAGAGGATAHGGSNGGGGATGAGGTSTSTSSGACPTDAFFCSGFEDATLPAKATYTSNIPTPVEVVLDSSVHNTGAQSVKVNPGTSYVYRMLSVPAAKVFWFRAYLRTDVPIDQKATVHESFMGANWGQDKGVDIVQEQCEVAVNINDNPVLGSNGQNPPITCPTDGQKIAANTWYCFEGYFDGGAGDLEIFVNGTSIIKGSGIAQAKQTFTNFRFGYVEYNGTNRTVWYDDVATGPNRIGCLQ